MATTTPEQSIIALYRECAVAASRILGIDVPEEVRRTAAAAIARAAVAARADSNRLMSELDVRAIIADVLRAELARQPVKAAPKGAA